MSTILVNVIKQMLIKIFRPLIKILLRLNIPFSIVSDTLKWTYVDVAKKHFGINNKPCTKSRIAVITGLSRPQIDIQLKLNMTENKHHNRQMHRAGKVLIAWVENDRYLDDQGKPLKLPLEQTAAPNFKELVDKYSGGATYRSIMDELLNSNSIVRNTDNKIELIKPYYMTDNDPSNINKINILAISTQYLIESIEHNLNPNNSKTRFQKVVRQNKLPISQSIKAESYIRQKSLKLTNEIDAYLEQLANQSRLEKGQKTIANIGLGIYFYQSKNYQNIYANKQEQRQAEKHLNRL